jgi:hypothetical protein
MITMHVVLVDVLARPMPLTVLAVALGAAALFGRRLARRRGVPPAVGVLFVAAVGAVLAVTSGADGRQAADFAPAPGTGGFLPGQLHPSRLADLVTTLPANGEQWANVALFLPVGLLAQAFWRHAAWSVGFCLTLSAVIEIWQAYVGRSTDLVDLRNNIIGAILGVILFHAAGSRVRGWTSWLLERMPVVQLTAVTAAAAAALLGLVVSQQGYHNVPRPEALFLVDPTLPNHELLDSVLAIVAARAGADPQFSYVPQTPPPGLRRMTGGSTDPIMDSYDMADPAIRQASVQFSAQPGSTCTATSAASCVRGGPLHPAPPDPQFRYVSVHLHGDVTASPSRAVAARYWSKVKLVPLAEAAWFTDLVTRAQAAPKRRV